MLKISNFLVISSFLCTAGLLAKDNQVSDEVLKLADKDLLPRRAQLNDEQNAAVDIEAIAKKYPNIATDVAGDTELTASPDKLSPKEKAALLAFREKNLHVRNQYLATAAKKCQIPDSHPMLIVNTASSQEAINSFLTADAIYLDDKKISSNEIKLLLTSYLAFSGNFLHCEGTMIQTLVGLSYLSAINDYIAYFAKNGRLSYEDTADLLEFSGLATPDSKFFIEQLKREYKYDFLAGISILEASLEKLRKEKPSTLWDFVFDLKETVYQPSMLIEDEIIRLQNKEPFSEKNTGSLAFAKYTTVDSKNKELRGIESMLRNFANSGEWHEGAQTLTSKNIGRKYPALKNYLGRITLFVLATNRTSRWKELIADVLKTKLLHLKTAVVAYKQTFHKVPSDLDELVAQGTLATLPVNELTKHELHYDAKAGSVLWAYPGNAQENIRLDP